MPMRSGGGFRGGGGGRPRRTKGVLADLKSEHPIDYKDMELMQKCVGSQSQILSRRRTGLTAKRQRELKQAVKRARHLALLPFVG